MSVLTIIGRVAIAKAIANEHFYLAWGSGHPDWDISPVAEDVNAQALTAEIGRRRASVVGFCYPDASGNIVSPDGRFTESSTPTRFLFMRFSFDFTDAPTADIRELAIFLGGSTDPDLPIGQMYFTPDQIVDPGMMLLLEHIVKAQRNAAERIIYEQVFPI